VTFGFRFVRSQKANQHRRLHFLVEFRETVVVGSSGGRARLGLEHNWHQALILQFFWGPSTLDIPAEQSGMHLEVLCQAQRPRIPYLELVNQSCDWLFGQISRPSGRLTMCWSGPASGRKYVPTGIMRPFGIQLTTALQLGRSLRFGLRPTPPNRSPIQGGGGVIRINAAEPERSVQESMLRYYRKLMISGLLHSFYRMVLDVPRRYR
jgi:hypothetical protein